MATSDARGDLTINSDTFTHTSNGPDTVTCASNGILDEMFLIGRTIGEVPVQIPLANPIVLAPQMMMTPEVKKIFVDTTSGNTWTNRTLRQVSRTGISRNTLGNIGHACVIS